MELQQVVDFFFPPQCAVCEAVGNGLCEQCFPAGPALSIAKHGLKITALGAYEGALKRAVLALKSGRRDVARAFAGRIRPLIKRHAIIVPVPTTAARRRQRGFDGCELIASLATGNSSEVLAGLKQTAGDSQRGRSRPDRLAASGRFLWRAEPLYGRRAILFDDVVTTGATLRDCAGAVARAGGLVEEAIVLAVA